MDEKLLLASLEQKRGIKMKSKYLLLAAFIFLSHWSWSQLEDSKSKFSLLEAQQYGLENNVNVINADLDVKAAKQRIWENTALGLPQVNASAGYTNNLKLMTTLIPAEFFGGEPGTLQPVQFGTQHNANVNISATQLIFNGPYIVGLQAASKYKELMEKSLDKSEEDLKEAVAISYYTVLMAESTRDALRANLANMESRLQETKVLYETGFLEETDADQLQITVSILENEYNSAVQMVELSYKMLINTMGYDPGRKIELTETLDEIISGLNTEILSQPFDITRHAEYKIFSTREHLAMLNVRMMQYEYMPTVSASFNHMQMAMRQNFNFFDFDQDWYPSTLVGINLSIPIFSSGNKKMKIAQAKVELEKTKNSKEYLSNSLELMVEQSRMDFSKAYQKYLNEKENITLAQKVLDKTSVKYQNGMTNSLDLTQASDQLVNVHTAYIAAIIELLNAKLSLDKALGNL